MLTFFSEIPTLSLWESLLVPKNCLSISTPECWKVVNDRCWAFLTTFQHFDVDIHITIPLWHSLVESLKLNLLTNKLDTFCIYIVYNYILLKMTVVPNWFATSIVTQFFYKINLIGIKYHKCIQIQNTLFKIFICPIMNSNVMLNFLIPCMCTLCSNFTGFF